MVDFLSIYYSFTQSQVVLQESLDGISIIFAKVDFIVPEVFYYVSGLSHIHEGYLLFVRRLFSEQRTNCVHNLDESILNQFVIVERGSK